MKVTRVILCANENPIYHEFWNPISRIYAENFHIKPTLIWFGAAEDIHRLGLSDEWGNIVVQKPNPNHHIGWQTAWAIFWFMSLYPNDTFCTMGIDQIPLSALLIRDIPSTTDDDSYLMLASNAYSPSHWENNGTSPTSFHMMKGSVACKVYGFEKTFDLEIEKLASCGIAPYYDKGFTKWGIDESYSSHKLRQYRHSGGKVDSLDIFKFICDRRIECCREIETPYDSVKLSEGWYGDAHFCRPFSSHEQYITQILNLIPHI